MTYGRNQLKMQYPKQASTKKNHPKTVTQESRDRKRGEMHQSHIRKAKTYNRKPLHDCRNGVKVMSSVGWNKMHSC